MCKNCIAAQPCHWTAGGRSTAATLAGYGPAAEGKVRHRGLIMGDAAVTFSWREHKQAREVPRSSQTDFQGGAGWAGTCGVGPQRDFPAYLALLGPRRAGSAEIGTILVEGLAHGYSWCLGRSAAQ